MSRYPLKLRKGQKPRPHTRERTDLSTLNSEKGFFDERKAVMSDNTEKVRRGAKGVQKSIQYKANAIFKDGCCG